uniref:Glycerophosphocholine phosphodiesterase n=1 Tax=Macrostomum lignano TaxID=282301 RepID=A0A1I8FAA1_9PLAT
SELGRDAGLPGLTDKVLSPLPSVDEPPEAGTVGLAENKLDEGARAPTDRAEGPMRLPRPATISAYYPSVPKQLNGRQHPRPRSRELPARSQKDLAPEPSRRAGEGAGGARRSKLAGNPRGPAVGPGLRWRTAGKGVRARFKETPLALKSPCSVWKIAERRCPAEARGGLDSANREAQTIATRSHARENLPTAAMTADADSTYLAQATSALLKLDCRAELGTSDVQSGSAREGGRSPPTNEMNLGPSMDPTSQELRLYFNLTMGRAQERTTGLTQRSTSRTGFPAFRRFRGCACRAPADEGGLWKRKRLRNSAPTDEAGWHEALRAAEALEKQGAGRRRALRMKASGPRSYGGGMLSGLDSLARSQKQLRDGSLEERDRQPGGQRPALSPTDARAGEFARQKSDKEQLEAEIQRGSKAAGGQTGKATEPENFRSTAEGHNVGGPTGSTKRWQSNAADGPPVLAPEQELHRRRCSELGLPLPDRIRENTLRSMLATHAAGGHFVEFDVQLSKDRVPIIHHNFYTDDGRFVGNLTLAELQAINEEDGCGPDEHQYSTLESFFRLLPDELGFDIEIKYPRQYKAPAFVRNFTGDLMDYVSTIVDSVRLLSNGSRRRIFYSCFVSDVCLALRRLHPEYPTVFLLNHKEGHKYTEVHGLNGRSGLKFAASAKLQGVAIRSEELQPPKVESMEDGRNVTEPGREFIIDCKRRKLRCLTWGPANNSSEFRRLQREWGVDGVIYDSIHARNDF